MLTNSVSSENSTQIDIQTLLRFNKRVVFNVDALWHVASITVNGRHDEEEGEQMAMEEEEKEEDEEEEAEEEEGE